MFSEAQTRDPVKSNHSVILESFAENIIIVLLKDQTVLPKIRHRMDAQKVIRSSLPLSISVIVAFFFWSARCLILGSTVC